MPPHRAILFAAIALSAVVAAFAARAILLLIRDAGNPCVQWIAQTDPHSHAAIAPPGCRSLSVHGESFARAVLRAVIVPGGLLASIGLFIAGLWTSRKALLSAAAGLMLAETLVVFTIAPITMLTGLSFLYLARSRYCQPPPSARYN